MIHCNDGYLLDGYYSVPKSNQCWMLKMTPYLLFVIASSVVKAVFQCSLSRRLVVFVTFTKRKILEESDVLECERIRPLRTTS
jgi:hypothetical protein